MNQDQSRAGRTIQRETGRTFHLATRLLPERVRHPTYILYGFFRVADEVVDDPGDRTPAEQQATLESIRAEALGLIETDDPVLSAFCDVRTEYDIPVAEVEVFLDAMAMDVDTDRYATVDELDAYVRGSAAAVGAMMTAIIDPDDPSAAMSHAHRLGEAFQLTNFIRDVREDVQERDRIYIPEETLEAHGGSIESIERLEFGPAVRDSIAAELRRTEARYHEGVAGIRYLPDDCQFPILLAAVCYAEHHRLVRDLGYDVLSHRPTLSRWQLARCLVRTWWYWRRHGDPELVFRRASAIPTDEPDSATGIRTRLPSR
ncbi:phytoene/squalene synthase family protein [Halovivax gelatinilyticus]|uniref:phytoene/squalene synthase family protein n=1 Tax=Halovivax gelatinilyticus TaxID=2961597 RepID=UPI0020CA39E9|nr:phytoene/squalene synthase family protein [Halovivax gelatinilyticus]